MDVAHSFHSLCFFLDTCTPHWCTARLPCARLQSLATGPVHFGWTIGHVSKIYSLFSRPRLLSNLPNKINSNHPTFWSLRLRCSSLPLFQTFIHMHIARTTERNGNQDPIHQLSQRKFSFSHVPPFISDTPSTPAFHSGHVIIHRRPRAQIPCSAQFLSYIHTSHLSPS